MSDTTEAFGIMGSECPLDCDEPWQVWTPDSEDEQMADRKTAIGKVLADIDGEILKLTETIALMSSHTPEQMQARIDELTRTREVVARHERPAVVRKPRAASAPKTAKAGK